jgi:SAM-dependent methyltransferase
MTAQRTLSPEEVVSALYEGIFRRRADPSGSAAYLNALLNGYSLSKIIEEMIASDEFRNVRGSNVLPVITLPDLTSLYPEKYHKSNSGPPIFIADVDDDFRFLERLIIEHRYYDSLGVWSPAIDLDKQITAAIVEGLGARRCVELGCFTGPVLSLLADRGIEATGVEVSHLAFLLAYPNIRNKIRYGDLLSVDLDSSCDVFLAMDVLEHLSPLRIDEYIARIAKMISSEGFVYLNSPMFGADRVFGTPFEAYLSEWQRVGDASFWRHLHCDDIGWPMHGHLIWASPNWWERQFSNHGLVRDHAIEEVLHETLASFFERAPARRSLFVLKRAQNIGPQDETRDRIRVVLSRALNDFVSI